MLPHFKRAGAVLGVALLIAATLTACGHKAAPKASATGPNCSYTSSGVAARAARPPAATAAPLPTTVSATITTDQGVITIALDPDKAPCTVRSFVSLAQQGFFNQTKCHRLTDAQIFVLQCGDPSATGSGGPGYQYADELVSQDSRLAGCANEVGTQVCTYAAGTVAMANSGPNTNGSQFFLVYKDSPLPYAYAIFGRMDGAGLQVVQNVAKGGVAADGTAPKTPVNIATVQITGEKASPSASASRSK